MFFFRSAWNTHLLPILACVLFLMEEFEEVLKVVDRYLDGDEEEISQKQKHSVVVLRAKALFSMVSKNKTKKCFFLFQQQE